MIPLFLYGWDAPQCTFIFLNGTECRLRAIFFALNTVTVLYLSTTLSILTETGLTFFTLWLQPTLIWSFVNFCLQTHSLAISPEDAITLTFIVALVKDFVVYASLVVQFFGAPAKRIVCSRFKWLSNKELDVELWKGNSVEITILVCLA